MNRKIKTLIVDDSALVRQVLGDILHHDPGIELIGAVADPIFAMRHMQKIWPDVIILDIEMPRMDGLTFLRKIMGEHPTPVIICSSLTKEGASITLEALSAGALEIITKPKIGLKGFLQESTTLLIDAVKSAALANLQCVKRYASDQIRSRAILSKDNKSTHLHPTTNTVLPSKSQSLKMSFHFQTTEHIIAIGTSTGGTQALEVILKSLPKSSPGIAVVQHMPSGFTQAFAKRLNSICQLEVKEASHNDRIVPGLVLIAPGDAHLLVKRSGAQYQVEVKHGPLVNRHRPSVDVLFRSVAQAAGPNAIGVIMTGMGNDGAAGLEEMHTAGALTIAQDEASCVVYGMPKEAVKRGAVDQIMPLEEIAHAILTNSQRLSSKS